jgi:methylated-DNA-[protein]-cysteine S-methyltransferase
MDYLDLKTPIGNLRLEGSLKSINRLLWVQKIEFTHTHNILLQKAKKQILEYFSGNRKSFMLPVSVEGTAFQRKIWGTCSKIGFGQTLTYGELAKRAGFKNAARAAGSAMAKNQLPLIIPCHRVVASNGALGGYSGYGGLKTKMFLLAHERIL